MKLRKWRADLLLIAGCLLIGIVILAALFLTRKEGNTVRVSVSGEVVKTFSLNEDVQYEIEGKDEGRNLLIIENGEAWVEEASCPDGLCINMGKIDTVGQSIVCLPNQVVVSIQGEVDENDENAVDVIVQ